MLAESVNTGSGVLADPVNAGIGVLAEPVNNGKFGDEEDAEGPGPRFDILAAPGWWWCCGRSGGSEDSGTLGGSPVHAAP